MKRTTLLIALAACVAFAGCSDDDSGGGSGGDIGSGGVGGNGTGGMGGDGTGGSPPPPPPPPPECTSDDDCDEGEVCFEGACADPGRPDPITQNIPAACTTSVLPEFFDIPIEVTVAPLSALEPGTEVEVQITGALEVPESLIEVLQGFGVDEVPYDGRGVEVVAREGATGDPVLSALGSGVIDITEDPDGNGAPGPIRVVGTSAVGTFAVDEGASEVVFDFDGNVGDSGAGPPVGELEGQSRTGAVAEVALAPGVPAVAVSLPCQSGSWTPDPPDDFTRPFIPNDISDLIRFPTGSSGCGSDDECDDDDNDCTVPLCTDGVCGFGDVDQGEECAGGFCDGEGRCLPPSVTEDFGTVSIAVGIPLEDFVTEVTLQPLGPIVSGEEFDAEVTVVFTVSPSLTAGLLLQGNTSLITGQSKGFMIAPRGNASGAVTVLIEEGLQIPVAGQTVITSETVAGTFTATGNSGDSIPFDLVGMIEDGEPLDSESAVTFVGVNTPVGPIDMTLDLASGTLTNLNLPVIPHPDTELPQLVIE